MSFAMKDLKVNQDFNTEKIKLLFVIHSLNLCFNEL